MLISRVTGILSVKFSSVHFVQKILLSFLLIGGLAWPSSAQDKQLEPIVAAFRSGDASAVSRYFGKSVDITVNNNSSTYSRTQGEQVLRDFFSRQRVRDFVIDYSGNSTTSDSRFTTGTLKTATCRYKVYLFLRPDAGSYTIKEVRIEK